MATYLVTATIIFAGLYMADSGRAADRRALVTHLQDLRPKVNRARARKCLPRRTVHHPARSLSTRKVVFAIRFWRGRLVRARAAENRCGPRGVIRRVFPAYAVPEAIRVAGCESTGDADRLDPYAKNPSSSASGLFQELSGWWDGSLLNYLGGQPFDPFDVWANTRQARWLWERSGRSFRVHWLASVGCWS